MAPQPKFSIYLKIVVWLFLFFVITSSLSAQNSVTVKIIGLKVGDTCTVQIQKSAEDFQFKKIGGIASGTPEHTFSNLSNGKWALKLDATGYYFPTAQVFELTGSTKSFEITLNPITLSNVTNYQYQWQDDSSFVGHAQQSYINEPDEIQVLDQKIEIPEDFSSINLLNRHGIALSDKISPWTPEDAFRLFQTIKRLPDLIKNEDKKEVNSVWYISDQDVIDDIQITERNNIKFVTISRKAFTYSLPLVVTLDGVKGRFYSKRLYKAIVNFATNYGNNSNAIDQLALSRFGVKFLSPNSELQTLMSEDFSNFQVFSAFEKITILSMFEELPDGMHIQNNLKFLVHRIAGQSNPKYPNAAAVAWTGLKTIEFMQSAFGSSQYSDIQRLMLHEKAHFMWEGLFDQKLRDDWATIGGWFLDPTSKTGWTTSNTTEFVSAYSHALNPNEDMAESIAAYVVNPDILRSRSLRKFEFIRDRVMQGTRYVSIIREDLTFQVYNLFPDYNYPGKIKKVEVKVNGLPNEDKEIIIRIELNKIDEKQDGASSAYTSLFSSIGTGYGLAFSPVDNGKGFILEGRRMISKFSKSGYWTVNQIALSDAVGNQRFENNSTFGIKIFINNPLEDYDAPRYINNTLTFSTGIGKYKSFAPREDPQGDTYQTIQAKFDINELNTLGAAGLNFAIPKNDENGVKNEFEFEAINNDPNYIKKDSINKSINHIFWKYPIPEYFPTGHYVVTQISITDDAQNFGRAFFMKDTSAFTLPPNATKHIRDSVYVKTKYPDFIPPILDLNQITVKATPSNPAAPDGETLFEMEFFARDSSAFTGNEAGIKSGNYILRDPQGKVFNFSMQNDFVKYLGVDFYYPLKDPLGSPSAWRKYKVSTTLPKGSAPGLWGVESITLNDRARNKKYYNFTEIVRFDLEKADSTKLVQPKVEILGKKVNAKNAEAISLSISCKDCKNKNYRARFYSSMGGNSVVNEGKMIKDSIVVENIKLTGVNDGILYATVFILDSTKTLLGIGKSIYAKDVLAPKSGILKTNLANFGKSNIDSLIYQIKASESKGSYSLSIKQATVTPIKQGVNVPVLYKTEAVIKTITGKFSNENISIKDSVLKGFEDGLIEITCVVSDSVDNESEPVVSKIYKDTRDPVLSINKTSSAAGKLVLNIRSNEYVSNSISNADMTIKNGTISGIKKLDNRNFEVSINRTCADTLSLSVLAGKLLDTVGNKNQAANLNLLDIQKPSLPTISVANIQNLSTTATGTYQWYLDNKAISGATQNNYVATASGAYTLVVTNAQGCASAPSAAITIAITGILEVPVFSIYPNPTRDRITIETESSGSIEIINEIGITMKKFTSVNSGETLDISTLNKGKYIIRFTDSKNRVSTFSLIKE
ncbi:MAG: T9SS type A sorting domain-containing protein [Cytophagales bacterium]|nr:T9SS type A sorting domain-containing protein [Cytophagales bacterium]